MPGHEQPAPESRYREVDGEAVLAVAAHGLLSPLAVISGFAQLLLEQWEAMDQTERASHLRRIIASADLATGILQDLVRGLPPDVRRLLDELDAESERRRGP